MQFGLFGFEAKIDTVVHDPAMSRIGYCEPCYPFINSNNGNFCDRQVHLYTIRYAF